MNNSFSLAGSTVLITGGTGSFGKTLAKQLLIDGAAEVRIFSRDEAKQDSMRTELGSLKAKYFLGDVRDLDSLRAAVKGADFVFHAAALKQVPSGEFFPLQVVKTNVLGSANVLEASIEFGVKSVVCLSTDKAVYPINAMGQSKALMEKTAQSYARMPKTSTRIAVTRYGNVLMSRGSVIPRFIEQIRRNDEITVTDPSMTRFLMTLEESVDLVKHAFAESVSGDIFVRKAPAATIGDLAQALVEIFDAASSRIRYVGIRHGEKNFESLLSEEERTVALDDAEFFRVPLDARDLNYSDYFDAGSKTERFEAYTSSNTERLDLPGIKNMLLALPEIQAELEKG